MDVVDRLTDWLIDLPPDRPANRPTDRPIDRPTARPPSARPRDRTPTDWIAEALVLSKKRSEIFSGFSSFPFFPRLVPEVYVEQRAL